MSTADGECLPSPGTTCLRPGTRLFPRMRSPAVGPGGPVGRHLCVGGCLSRAPWLLLNSWRWAVRGWRRWSARTGAGLQAQGLPPHTSFALPLLDGCGNLLSCSLRLLFRLGGPPCPYSQASLGLRCAQPSGGQPSPPRSAPRSGPDLHHGIGPQPQVVSACLLWPWPRRRASLGSCVPEQQCGQRASITSAPRAGPLSQHGP